MHTDFNPYAAHSTDPNHITQVHTSLIGKKFGQYTVVDEWVETRDDRRPVVCDVIRKDGLRTTIWTEYLLSGDYEERLSEEYWW